MANAATYSLTTTGQILDGFELQDVVTGFASLFDIAPEKAAAYADRKKLIRKGLSREQTDEYVEQLARIGMVVAVHEGVISRPRHLVQSEASVGETSAGDDLPEELVPHDYRMSNRLPIILIGVAGLLVAAFVIAYIRAA